MRFRASLPENQMAKPYIDAIAAERLLRDLEAAASATLPRVVADARDHIWLLERIGTVDVTGDAEFQRQLCRHAGMRGKLRMRREGAGADAGGVGLRDAPDLVDVLRPRAGAGAGRARDRVGEDVTKG